MGNEITNEIVKAYARAYGVCERAIKRAGGRITGTERDFCEANPPAGFTIVYMKAVRMRALDSRDEQLIGLYLDSVPGDFEVKQDKRISFEKRGVFTLEKTRWHDMTPDQAAKVLGVTKQRVSALIKNEQLDAVKIGGRYYLTSYSVHQRAREMKNRAEG